METRIGLKSPYVNIQRKEDGRLSYGGDQGFFRGDKAGRKDLRKAADGCGIIAFSDLMLYLSGSSGHMTEEAYKGYFNEIFRKLGGFLFKGGISSMRLMLQFNRLAGRSGLGLRAGIGFCNQKMHVRIEEMLQRNIPVILCIPAMLLPWNKKHGIWLYRRTEEGGTFDRAAFTSSHFVMVTALLLCGDKTYYEISSWGKKYYIDREEYERFAKTHFLGRILGNILYIR